MKKEEDLRKRMRVHDKGEKSFSTFQLPEVRSSVELLKQFKIKQEKVISNIGGPVYNKKKSSMEVSKQRKGSGQEQFKLSNFATNGQAKGITQPKVAPQNQASGQTKGMIQNQPSGQTKGTTQSKVPLQNQASGKTRGMPQNQASGQTKGTIQSKVPLQNQASGQTKVTTQSKVPTQNQTNGQAKGMTQPKAPTQNDITRQNHQPMKRIVREDDGLRTMQGTNGKKSKIIPMCGSMLIDEFLKENGEVGEEEELQDESANEEENFMEQEENAQNGGETIENTIEGTSKKRTRGPTQCLKVHARDKDDRQEVVLDDDGEPIGPNGQIVSELSHFLGTIARNADFCPLIYTNFKALVKDKEAQIWGYVNDKYIVPEKGRKGVFSRINDAWRRHKSKIKKHCFLKYSNMKERLKHRPNTISEAHFKQLMTYWRNSNVQSISKKNAVNRTKQKYMHRTGPINFARIRAQLQAKKENGEEITQAEMFIETRKSRKGKELDEETQSAIAKLEDSIQNSTEAETFQSLFGNEKPGRVRCYGRTVTPSILKKMKKLQL